jgi:hypothetical protein
MKPCKAKLYGNVDKIEPRLLERSGLRIHAPIPKNSFHCFELDLAGNDPSKIELLQLLLNSILQFILTCIALRVPLN